MEELLTILQTTAVDDLLEAGIKAGNRLYLVRDGRINRFLVVKWDLTHWICSCNKGACTHQLQVNTFVFNESQKQRMTGEDLAAHLDDQRSAR